MVGKEKLVMIYFLINIILVNFAWAEEDEVINPSKLEMFVDVLPDMPRIKGFDFAHDSPVPTNLNIGMYQKLWVCFYCFCSSNSFKCVHKQKLYFR